MGQVAQVVLQGARRRRPLLGTAVDEGLELPQGLLQRHKGAGRRVRRVTRPPPLGPSTLTRRVYLDLPGGVLQPRGRRLLGDGGAPIQTAQLLPERRDGRVRLAEQLKEETTTTTTYHRYELKHLNLSRDQSEFLSRDRRPAGSRSCFILSNDVIESAFLSNVLTTHVLITDQLSVKQSSYELGLMPTQISHV